ncbi:ABC transporter substrate-binding protein [Roseomonas hellenica]|uniref:ABC transporter substrate-binding protein n=1 Tax=Plastoroseomonas hellenica TaxID=2687306 RepID=A0ABS5EYW3_9PROT|nr:substrate-binding domain-containing protein [Plastoroseomonas hellenica]MBR0665492.1 ABC transporter substrate-binding protein [Plastoroseomonas hellenica]
MASSLPSPQAVQSRHRLARRSVLAGILLGFAALRPVRAAAPIRVGGTGSALGALHLLATAFRDIAPGIEISVLPSLGTSGGLRALQASVIDLAVTARTLTAGERAAGLQEREYARTPLVFATGSDIGRRDLSCDDVAQIYAGEMTEWPDGTPVRLIRRPPTEADWAALGGLSPAMARAIDLAMRRPGLITAASDQDNADAIETVRGSFGLLALGQMLSERRRLVPFALDGIGPDAALAELERWRLVRSLHIVTSSRTPAEARAFADFVSGPAAGAVLAGCGHVPTGEARG